jgi:hypothetical protein
VGANNGSLTFWVDGTPQPIISGIDNDTHRIDQVRLGVLAGRDAGTTGTFYMDAFVSRRLTLIGPEVGGLAIDLVEPETPTVEPTEEITPEVTPEATVDITPEITPEVTPEPTAEVTPEITPEPTIEPTSTPEPTETPSPEPTNVTPEPTLLPFTLPVFQTMDDGAPLWSASAGWQLSSDAAFSGQGWRVLATGQAETLSFNVPINLGAAAAPTLTFQSRLVSGTLAEVRVSVDGVNWQTAAFVVPSEWTPVQVSLAAYAGQTVKLQFVWTTPAGTSDTWQVDEVTVVDQPLILPTAPTVTEPAATPVTPVVPTITDPNATVTPAAPGEPVSVPTIETRGGVPIPEAPGG